ncbi:MAG TPA: PAS domain-containing sensor histidine kinase [Chitinophagales bacterium]|nr:PAS domain-containing sensor histidine kinase [Chitinophagales bacterium]
MNQDYLYDYKLLFNNKTVGILIVNKNGEVIEANDFSCELLKYSKEELESLKIEDLVPRDLAHQHKSHRENYTQRPHTRIMGVGLDLYALRKDGTVFPIEISLSPFEKNGEKFTIAFLIDSTIRKLSEQKITKQNIELEHVKQELEKLNLELEKKVEERTFKLQEALEELEHSKNELSEALDKEKELGELKSRFVSMASHEFRTPLSTILSSAGLIHRYIESNTTQNCERHIQRIKSSVEHLNFILEDFLSLGKIEEGLIKDNQENFDIQTEIEMIVNEMKQLARAGQEIKIQTKDTISLTSDKHLLKIAVSNLISNAIKFSHEGGLIEVILEKKANLFAIHIIDQGIGIPLEDQKHIFSRFFRASNSSNIQGTGLGIYIVKRYIEIIGGKLNFDSIPNQGTTFTIELPL